METGKKLKHRILEKINLQELLLHFDKKQLALNFKVTTGFIDRTIKRQTDSTIEIIQFKYFMDEELDGAVKTVCEHYKVTVEQLKMESRIREYAEPRKVLYYLFYLHFNQSPNLIARFFNRTHGAIISSANSVKNRLEVDLKYRNELNDIFKQLNIKTND